MWPLKLLQSEQEAHHNSERENIPLQQLRTTQASHNLAPHIPNRFTTPRQAASSYIQPTTRNQAPLPHPLPAMDTSTDDILLNLARRSAHVTQQLQRLLDAQSDGLLKGLGRDPAASTTSQQPDLPYGRSQTVSPDVRSSIYRDDPFHAPSSSPARSRISSGKKKVVPVRQPPPPKTPSLREARNGITENLRALAAIKADEAQIHSKRAQTGGDGLVRIKGLVGQRDGLVGEIARLEDRGKLEEEEEGLNQQELQLDSEIRALEERLSELRAKLREVRREKSERANQRAAEVSSFRNALNDVKRTIKRDVLSDRSEYRRASRAMSRKREGVWALPEDRRTPELVREDVEAQIYEAEEQQKAAVDEGSICEEGSEVWDGVVSQLTTLEQRLGLEIRKMNANGPPGDQSDATSSSGKTNVNSDLSTETRTDGMQGVLDLMSTTASSLSSDLAKAEEKGWTLLVCCIGAEIEALKEARELLGDTLVQSQILSPPASAKVPNGGPAIRHDDSDLTASMYTANESTNTITPAFREQRGGTGHEEEEEHDVPDPQALFGDHEDDGEHELQGPELLVAED